MWAALRAKLKGYRTIIANALVGVPAAVMVIYTEFASVDFTPVIPAKYVAIFVLCNAVLGVILRILTTGPIGSKDA